MCSYLHIDKEVLRLDVTVNHFLGMAVGKSISQLSYVLNKGDYNVTGSIVWVCVCVHVLQYLQWPFSSHQTLSLSLVPCTVPHEGHTQGSGTPGWSHRNTQTTSKCLDVCDGTHTLWIYIAKVSTAPRRTPLILHHTHLRCDCISISLLSWCSTEARWSWTLNSTFNATTNLLVFSLAR